MRWLRPGFTTRARCLLAGGLTAALFGVLFGEVDLVRAGCLVVAVPIVAAIVVNRSQVTIASRRSAEPARVPVGSNLGVQLTVTNRSVLPSGSLMLEDRLPAELAGRARFGLDGLAGRESRTVAYRIPALHRGRYAAGPLRVRLTDPFGMIDATRSFTATSRLVVTPAVDLLPDAHTPYSVDVGDNAGSHSIGSYGADDASTREYRHGDDLRKIHWRSTARTGALMVRHEERPWQGHTTVLLDLRAGAHEAALPTGALAGAPAENDPRQASSLEWAISAVASIGNQLFLSGRDVSLLADSSDGRPVRFAESTTFVDHLADLGPTGGYDLSRLVAPLRAAARDSTVVSVFGALSEPDATAVAATRARGSAVPAFAILLDSASWRFVDTGSPQAADLAAYGSARAVAAAEILRAAGWWAIVARCGDSIGGIWSRLLSQRAYATGGSIRVGATR